MESRRAELLAQDDAATSGGDPETSVICRERPRLVREALAAIPRPQRRAALARFHGDLSYDEAAARAGVATVTARTRVHRAGGVARAAGRAAVAVLSSRRSGQHPGAGLHRGPGSARAPSAGVAIEESTLAAAAAMPHFAPARVMVAEAAPAARKKTAPVRAAAAATNSEVPPVQELSFENDTVEGDLAGPDSVFVRGLPEIDQPSLIELRRHFIPEMLETLEDL